MNITILDDNLDFVRHLSSFNKVSAHNVTIWNEHTKDIQILAQRLRDTEALVLIRERTPITAQLIESLGNLRIISQHGPIPHIDIDACTRRGVIVSSGHSSEPSYPTAELTWGLMIAAMRKIPQEMASLRAGKWQTALGSRLRGKTLGIYGYGRLGPIIAGYGKAFGMKVLVWARPASRERALKDGYDVAHDRIEFFESCDVISLHMRLVDATRNIVTAEDLGRMKPKALIVNTSRSGLIEPGALEAALQKGRPGMAAVDVYDDEPLVDVNHPLLTMNNVVSTPHIGYGEYDHCEHVFDEIFDQILAYANGAPINVKNPIVLNNLRH